MIYFLHAPDVGLLKIGSTLHPRTVKTRLAAETRQTGGPVVLLGTRDGDSRGESALHMRHAAAWVVSEWFEDTPAVRATVEDRPYIGPDVVDIEEVRAWVRSWRTPWKDICRLSGVGIGSLAAFADGGPALRIPSGIGLGRAFMVVEQGRKDVSLSVPRWRRSSRLPGAA